MSYRDLTMIEIREVLHRWQTGQSIRENAREGCVDRKTARRYVQAAEQCGVPRDVAAISDAHVQAVAERVQARPAVSASAEREQLLLRRVRIEAWLSGEPALRLSKVHRLLERDGVSVSGWRLPGCRVAPAGCPTGALTDPDVPDSGIRLFGSRVCCSGIRDPRPRERVPLEQSLHPIPTHPRALRTPVQPPSPHASDSVQKACEGFVLSDDAEIPEVAS